MSTIGVGKSFHDNARQSRRREERREALRQGRGDAADEADESFVQEQGQCIDCGQVYGQEHLIRLGDGRYRCSFCEVDRETETRLRRQLHARIGAAPVLAPLGLMVSLPLWLWMYGGYSHAQAGIFLLVPPVLGVLGSVAASIDNLRAVLIIERYRNLLDVRPAERALLTLSAVAGFVAAFCVALTSIGLVLTPSQWNAVRQALGL